MTSESQDQSSGEQRAKQIREKYLASIMALPETTIPTFLATTPPDKQCRLADCDWATTTQIRFPAITLHCENQICEGDRIFRPTASYAPVASPNLFITYKCSNCDKQTKEYAFKWFTTKTETDQSVIVATKLGESPAFKPYIPSRVVTLIGPDRELFLQGTRAEARGMGIGAFAYYRRVVENQRSRIISEIAKVAKLRAQDEQREETYVKAINETRFQQSIELVKDVLPPVLFIGGNNPLTLLHSALSSGLHDPDMSDEHCLALAQSIRIVLTELAERIAIALKDNRELSGAVSTLLAQKRR